MINQLTLGSHHFKIGLLLPNSNLINGILYNSEVWYGLYKMNIKKLEKVDEIFLRNLLNAHSKTSTEALYIETGTVPLRFIIQCRRRLLYWKHLNSINKNRLISKVYNAQKKIS